MQFPYQIKLLFVFCTLCYYGNFTVYQLQWSQLKWVGPLDRAVFSHPSKSHSPVCLFMLILFYANHALLFGFVLMLYNLIHRRKANVLKALWWNWQCTGITPAMKHLGGVLSSHFPPLAAVDNVFLKPTNKKLLRAQLILLTSAKYAWFCS